jgi:hypothetical protein
MDAQEFEFKVIEVVENEDGSATLILDMNSKAAHAFLSMGVLRSIELGLEAQEESNANL